MLALLYFVVIISLLGASIYYGFQVLINPMFWVLILCGILYFIGGWWLLVPCVIGGVLLAGHIANC